MLSQVYSVWVSLKTHFVLWHQAGHPPELLKGVIATFEKRMLRHMTGVTVAAHLLDPINAVAIKGVDGQVQYRLPFKNLKVAEMAAARKEILRIAQVKTSEMDAAKAEWWVSQSTCISYHAGLIVWCRSIRCCELPFVAGQTGW